MFKILYKTGKTEKEFSKLELVEKSGKENNEISPFFQKNLKHIFPELIFIFKEKTEKKQLDTSLVKEESLMLFVDIQKIILLLSLNIKVKNHEK